MNFPRINEYKCPPAADQCPDSRCEDPTFAAANPVLCGGSLTLVLKPEVALLCKETDATQQFRTYARSAAGEIELTAGVSYESSDPSILSIDAGTGEATALAAGIVTVTATVASFGQSAYAQATVLGPDCCDGVCVHTVLLEDVSWSMAARHKGDRAKLILKHIVITTMDGGKDYMAWIRFHQAVVSTRGWANDISVYDPLAPPWYQGTLTNLRVGLEAGLLKLSNAPACELSVTQQVLLLASDGQNVPEMSEQEVAELLALADAFKQGGGIIVVVGIQAKGDGFTLLQALASGGFFYNDKGQTGNTSATDDIVSGIGAFYCGCGTTDYPVYGCAGASAPGEQTPDESAPTDPEVGA